MEKGKPVYFHLSCAVQTYAWGKVGSGSEVARLKSSAEPTQFQVDINSPYAELWMGTHVRGPSTISRPKEYASQLLSDWLKANQWALGDKVADRFDGQLPFLFKVLSINKALSIQAHPTKSHAEQLHRSAPELYRDPNHKPELVIALKDFEGLCGFRPFDEIVKFLKEVPELCAVAREENSEHMIQTSGSDKTKRAALKKVFSAVMKSEEKVIEQSLKQLLQRARDGDPGLPAQERSLLLRLNDQFPGDIGCFCVFFLNYVTLKPGESLFLAPNEPHAYLSGDVIECMACSDNVVRAGLTQKHRDKDTLCEMLTYNMSSPEENKFSPQRHPTIPNAFVYDPPTPEFAVTKIDIPTGTKELCVPSTAGPSIFLMVSGSLDISCNGCTEEVNEGTVLFLSASSEIKLCPKVAKDVLVFQAYCSL